MLVSENIQFEGTDYVMQGKTKSVYMLVGTMGRGEDARRCSKLQGYVMCRVSLHNCVRVATVNVLIKSMDGLRYRKAALDAIIIYISVKKSLTRPKARSLRAGRAGGSVGGVPRKTGRTAIRSMFVALRVWKWYRRIAACWGGT